MFARCSTDPHSALQTVQAQRVTMLCVPPPSSHTQAHTVLHVCCLLEALRGCTRATLSATQPAVLAASLPLLQPLLRLQHAFRGHAVVVTLLLKLAAEMVENHISFLRPAESDALMRWVLELLQQYSRDNRWTKNLATSRSLQVCGCGVWCTPAEPYV